MENNATCKLVMDNQHVLTLTVPRGGDGVTEAAAATGHTIIEGIAHQNGLTHGGSGEQTLPVGEGIALELGNHPLADELRSFGLDKEVPIHCACTEHMSGSFGHSIKFQTKRIYNA